MIIAESRADKVRRMESERQHGEGKPGLFYGWKIVGTGILGMILVYGIRHSFAVFFTPILDEFHWSRGNIAIMMSLNIFAYGFLAPVAGAQGGLETQRVGLIDDAFAPVDPLLAGQLVQPVPAGVVPPAAPCGVEQLDLVPRVVPGAAAGHQRPRRARQ